MTEFLNRHIWAKRVLTNDGWLSNAAIEINIDGRFGRICQSPPGSLERYGVIIPAPVNLHSHSFQRMLAGLAEAGSPGSGENFWSWRDVMYRLVGMLTPDDVEAITELAQVEMLEAGFASVCEFHYLHHGPDGAHYDHPGEIAHRIMAASRATGIGLVMLPVLYQHGGCDRRPLDSAQRRFGNSISSFELLFDDIYSELSSCHDDASMGIAMHSLRAVEADAVLALPPAFPGKQVHIHVAEQDREVQEVVSHYGARPVEWLLDNTDLGPRWCLIHCTRMVPRETTSLARSGAAVGLCPVTESNLGDGIFDAARYQNSGGTYGIGTDSNVCISQHQEYRMLEYSQRLANRGRSQLASNGALGRNILGNCVRGGASAAGHESSGIQTGAWANLMELGLPPECPDSIPDDSLLDLWIFSGSDRMVSNVWSGGRHMVKDGRHVDRERIERHYHRTASRIIAEL